MKNTKKMLGILLTATTALGCFAGCGSKKSETVSTDGSTSMSKVIGALGEAYEKETGVKVTYNPTGSGTGIQAVAEGRCDIGLSSRALKEDEKQSGLTETVLAYDGIAVIVHTDNPIADLSLDEIADIYTGKITDWGELTDKSGEIVLIGREANSGTRDGFETITDTAGSCLYRQELSSNGDVIATVSSNPNAIGYASLATVKDTVKVLSVNGVTPLEATVKDGSYAIARPFMLITKSDTAFSPTAQRFFDYALSDKVNELLSTAGAVPAR